MKDVELIVPTDRAEEATQLGKYVRDDIYQTKSYMRKHDMVALAAPCIGINKRIICLNMGDDKINTYINPVITEFKGFTVAKETCDCMPGKTYLIPRNTEIKVMYQVPTGAVETKAMKGVVAILFQHLMQHLDGISIDDIGFEIYDDFNDMTEDEQNEVIKMYLDSLDLLQKDLMADEKTKQVMDASEFIGQVNAGKVKLETIS